MAEKLNQSFFSFPLKLIRSLLSSPAGKGLIGALLVQFTPWTEEISKAIWLPSRGIILLALCVVGMRLGTLWPLGKSTLKLHASMIRTTLLIKLIALPLVMFVGCSILQMPSLTKEALVLQAAAPTAISVLLIAEANNNYQNTAAVAVALSTLIAFVTVPFWVFALQL